MKKLFILFFISFSWSLYPQNQSNAWEGYFSFFKIKDVAVGNNLILAASENAIFTTDIYSDEQEEITSLEGLSGDEISAITFIENKELIVIGYENGLIQTYDLNSKKTKSYIDILQKPTITPNERPINDFYIYGNHIYISTNYGISKLNIDKSEFSDTYYIGDSGDKLGVNSSSVYDDHIFAATQGGGLRYAHISNTNIVDYNEWQQVESGEIQFTFDFQNQLYIIANNVLKIFDGNSFSQITNFQSEVKDVKVNGNYFAVTFNNRVQVYDQQLNMVSNYSPNEFQPQLNTSIVFEGSLYIGDEEFGLVETALNSSSHLEYLSPNGPLRNDIFDMDVVQGELWAAYGEYDVYYNPYPLRKRGVSHLSEKQWINFPYEDFPGENRSITSVKINPSNPEQVYFASFHDALMEINDDQIVNFYNTDNSNLEPSEHPNERPYAFRIGPMDFDPEGNLWFAASSTSKGLIKFKPGGNANSFEKIDITSVLPQPLSNLGFGSLTIDNSGNVYIGSYREGFIGFNPQTNKFAKIKGDGKNMPSNHVRALAVDHNNQLWIGTAQGLRILYSPSQMFENPNTSVNNIVFLDDDGIAQELFANLFITDIAVDGNNNKWVGSTAGVYQVSSDGQKTNHHFTTENSPLPSNNINSIKVDGTTGKVYIATQKGLVAFRGSATSAQQNLDNVRAYPNPVRPRYEGMVTIDGLMKNSNVKITDIEGNLVHEEFSQGGSIQWDTKAFGKHKVASGVYLVLITSEDQSETKVTKIMIIR